MDSIRLDLEINYEKLFHASPSLYLVLKPDAPVFTILEASDSYLRATMCKREEVRGKSLFTVFPDNPDDTVSNGSGNLRSSLERAIESKLPDTMPVQKYDIPIPPEKGGGFEVRYWNPNNTPVLNKNNEIDYIIHMAEDVTATIQLEQKHNKEAHRAATEIKEKSDFILENHNRINTILDSLLRYTTLDFSQRLEVSEKGDELDAIIIGLNSLIDELENQMTQLTAVNTELEYANKELDSFSYSVSHDLRSPLRAINGYSEVLLEDYADKMDEDGKRTIDVIVRNATRMATLIDDLLSFSRVSKQNLTKVPQDMNGLVNTVIMELVGEEKNARTEITVHPLEPVEGDGSMLKQVITNLISNGLKYSGKKEKSILDIGCYKKDTMTVFYVKDNGVGFDMKYYDKLFGVFQRLHNTGEFEGTGVGLALVQRIIRKHKGEIWAEAKPGEGATFYFSLPTL